MKKPLFVTFSTGGAGYLDQAKSLFYSAAAQGWDGDFMLIAHNVLEEDQEEFIKRGILVREENEIPIPDPDMDRNILSVKLNIFDGSLAEWSTVLFVDSDCFVLRPIDIESNRFSAVQGLIRRKISERIHDYEDKERLAFNAGLFAFNPTTCVVDINEFEKTWNSNKSKMRERTDETLLNICFPEWEPLPLLYNVPAFMFSKKVRSRKRLRKFPPVNFEAVKILHCVGNTPSGILPFFFLNLLWGFENISHISQAKPQVITPCVDPPM